MFVKDSPSFVSTRNACKLCAPLGACLAFRGVEQTVPFLHGSQGCATYIRRYMISHFKEPVDIASSSFGESAAIFGGKDNFEQGIINVIRQYNPKMIGIASTCLSETIGDDVSMYLRDFIKKYNSELKTEFVNVSTPSYSGTHAEGFYKTLQSLVNQLAEPGKQLDHINVLGSMFSPADIRYIKEILEDVLLPYSFLPDYSDTLDGPVWEEYHCMPEGGTPISAIKKMGQAKATLEFGSTIHENHSAGTSLQKMFEIPCYRLPLPIGLESTDQFMNQLQALSSSTTPKKYEGERGRLIDAYADGHKYIFGKRAMVYGEQDYVVSLARFMAEIGITPVICASGAKSGKLEKNIKPAIPDWMEPIQVLEGKDFAEIEELAETVKPDLLIGSSKGVQIARRLNIPLIRIGFPVHDRFGGARILHMGYRGTQQLFDRIVNVVLEKKQADSTVGYFYQ